MDRKEKIAELADKIGESIIELTAEYEGKMEPSELYALIVFASFCALSGLMDYFDTGISDSYYNMRSYEFMKYLLIDYASKNVDDLQ